ncbi:ABC transporter ATP-binding protein [Corynebacterium uberis]|uniref:ABC transporter ATP-binding protein n=1 Tax=Corynebacterium TaxID=1716 RepID=UPI001D09B341|nr:MULTISPECIES: ABC transporter ATP-binding protein [Corynebacterium]MCZ9309731.1 ABC transporter ATP-binding protein [Corynebacterium sp. c6VSa_13]UDL73535.1 ABC transporter ATP-binding protein [Corynebacterium uberis]UDL75585.1 ABC transporter ATP-binding protein [Corynebacterium uberis]UDL77798.1 ABC transporter ATP-binding protein [Corynebacterium uberis]UDL80081.1 ABC transporter ATP-binding protein [Corynebacterium uberis]
MSPTPVKSAIHAHNLAVRLSTNTAPLFSDLTLDVAAGESISIVGTSGEGKTTLLHTLAGLIRPESGSVHITGRDIYALSPKEQSLFRLTSVGYVFQFAELIPELTLLENVMVPNYLAGATRRDAKAAALKHLAAVGIDAETASRTPDHVSGGQAQRAGIARALINQPPVVLADEPTGSLDAATSQDVLAVLLKAVADTQATLVLVTHDAAVAHATDRSVRLEGGRLHEC